jgi:hypothetical protein
LIFAELYVELSFEEGIPGQVLIDGADHFFGGDEEDGALDAMLAACDKRPGI